MKYLVLIALACASTMVHADGFLVRQVCQNPEYPYAVDIAIKAGRNYAIVKEKRTATQDPIIGTGVCESMPARPRPGDKVTALATCWTETGITVIIQLNRETNAQFATLRLGDAWLADNLFCQSVK